MTALADMEGRPLKVLFLGNDDNYHFQLAKWSREIGIDADLWLIQPTDPFRGDIQDIEPDMRLLPIWVKEVSVGDPRRFALSPAKIGERIDQTYDFVSLAGPGSLMSSLRLRVPRCLWCIGAEVGDLPFPFHKGYRLSQGNRPLLYNLGLAVLVRAALRRVDFIIDSFEAHTPRYRQLGLQHKRHRFGAPADCRGERSRIRPILRDELVARYSAAKRVFMWFSRTNFSDPDALIYKGVELYLSALEKILPQLQSGEVRLVIGKHGNEVEAFMKLVEANPVKPYIEWVEHLGADELVTYLSIPNAVLFAEFGKHNVNLSGIGRNAAAIGTVTVSSAAGESIIAQYGRAPPILHATTAQEIASQMNRLIAMPEDEFSQLQKSMQEFGEEALDYRVRLVEFYSLVRQAISAKEKGFG